MGLKAAKMLHALTDAIYPPQCAGCMTLTDAPHGLCPTCWKDTSFITGAICASCGIPVPGTSEDGLRCDDCHANPPDWTQGRAAIMYTGVGRRVLLSFKHGDRLDLARTLAGWMAGAGSTLIETADIVAPVPLHRWRLLSRKFNQAAELARQPHISGACEYCPDLVTRIRSTTLQKNMTREERLANMAGAFEVPTRHLNRLKGKSVLLIDDVMTTGATLSTLSRCLSDAGAETVNVLALARVAPGRSRYI